MLSHHAVRNLLLWGGAIGLGLVGTMMLNASGPGWDMNFTKHFGMENREFCNVGRNHYVILDPGYRMLMRGVEDGEVITVLTRVLDRTRRVTIQTAVGPKIVDTRVLEEREWIDGELAQVSRSFLARDRRTDDIFFFGEQVEVYENGEIVSDEGSWRAGLHKARAGILMPGSFLLGARYYQSLALPVTADRAEHYAMGVSKEVPAGVFEDCIVVDESSGIEPDEKVYKVYAPGVGLIKDGPLELVSYGPLDLAEGRCDQ